MHLVCILLLSCVKLGCTLVRLWFCYRAIRFDLSHIGVFTFGSDGFDLAVFTMQPEQVSRLVEEAVQKGLSRALDVINEHAVRVTKELEARVLQATEALAKSQVAAPAPATRTFVRQVALDKFAGDSTAVRGWLYALEVATRDVSDDDRIDIAEVHLTGTARTWSMQLAAAHDPRPQSWAEWVARFRARFAPVSDTRLRTELDTLRQESTVQAYIDKFTDICQQLPDLSEQHKVFQFVKGLRGNIGAEVRARAPKTFIDAARLADQYEDSFFGGGRGRALARQGTLAEVTSGTSGSQAATPMEIDALVQQLAALQVSSFEELAALRDGQGTRGSTSRPPAKCWYCNKVGHLQADCRKRQRDNAPLVTIGKRSQQGRPRPNDKAL
eukprot:TRINITY_DN1255_c0_g4_i1.p1 TRINITY_DN1255_c0_g4~~TRINITY_DN1255_c0_g4_i1.p1  ORF type:complete len:384 (-),score=43.83 TRINITY_DN1255_c0_g4_i1:458-1609(-)